jgi:hypothetical protein
VAYDGVIEAYQVSSCAQLPNTNAIVFNPWFVGHGYPDYNAINPQLWQGTVYQTGGLSCTFGFTESQDPLSSILFF